MNSIDPEDDEAAEDFIEGNDPDVNDGEENLFDQHDLHELQKIFEMSLSMICIADINTAKFLKVNPAFTKVLGYSEEELINRSFLEFVHPDDIEKTKRVMEEKLKLGEKLIKFQNRYRTKEGSYVWLEWFSHPDPETGLTYAVSNDITVEKEMEKNLRRTEEKFKRLTTESPTGIYLTDSNGKCTYVNEKWLEMAGMEFEEAMGDGWVSAIHPNDRERVRSNWKKMVDERGEWGYDYRFLNKEGKVTWVHGTASEMRDDQGRNIGYVGNNVVINEIKDMMQKLEESESKLRFALNSGKADIFEMNLAEGTCIYGEEWAERLGYEYGEVPFTIDGVQSVIPDEDVEQNLKKLEDHLMGRSEYYTTETRAIKKDGTHLWVYSRGKVIERDGSGNPLKILGTNFDITRVKEMQNSLGDSEERYRTLVEGANQPIFTVDLDGRFLFMNEFGAGQLGSVPDDIIGKKMWDIFPKEYADRQMEYIREAIDLKSPITIEAPSMVRGELHWYEVKINPITTSGKMKPYVLCILIDITDRKKAENELSTIEEKYKLAMEVTTDGVWDWDIPSGKVYYTLAWGKILDLEDIPQVYETWYDRIHPEDKEEVRASVRDHLDGITDNWRMEHRLKVENGAYKWVLGRGKIVKRDNDGNPVRMVGTMTDISLRKSAERIMMEEKEKAQRYLDIAKVIMLALDNNGNIEMINRAGLEVLGYEQEELIGKSWFDTCLPGPDKEEITKIFSKALEGDKQVLDYHENPIVTKSGELRLIAWKNTNVKDKLGNIIGTFSSGEDITEIRKAEIALKEKEKALRLEKYKSQFYLDLLTHDIGNIHQGMYAGVQLLKRNDYLNYEDVEQFRNIESLVRRSIQLTRNVKLLSRVLKMERELEPINVVEVIQRSANTAKEVFKEKDIVVDIENGSDDILINAEPILEQLFFNLFHNSIKYSDRSDPRIDVKISILENSPSVKIEITDNGPGLPDVMVGHLFSRVEESDKKVHRGIGLVLVGALAERYGGQIKEGNLKDEGSVTGSKFEILLPLLKQ